MRSFGIVSKVCCFVAISAMVSGCASFKTYDDAIPFPKFAKNETVRTSMSLLTETLDSIGAQRDRYQDKRDEIDITRNVLNQSVFFLAAGAATSLIFDWSRALTLGLGTGAGATYTYGALFYPSPRAALYNAGAEALTCVHEKGSPTLVAVSTINLNRARADVSRAILDVYKTTLPANDPFRAEIEAAINAYAAALEQAEALLAKDVAASESVRRAAQEVVSEVNKQAQATAPDIGQVFQAAVSIGAIAQGFVPKKTPAPAEGERALEEAPVPTSRQDAQLELAVLKDNTAAIAAAVSAAQAGLDSLSAPCSVDIAATAPLSVEEKDKSITLSSNQSYTINVKGGVMPLSLNWNGMEPEGKLLYYGLPAPRTIRLQAGEVASEATYSLRISDMSGEAVDVSIGLKN